MKKVFLSFLLILTLCSAAIAAFAKTDTGDFETALDLYNYWNENGFPDYVCGVWTKDGNIQKLTISVLDNEEGERGRQEILLKINDDSTVAFEYGEYSLNELIKIQEELFNGFINFKSETKIFSADVDEINNCVLVGLDLQNADEQLERFIIYCQKIYGDKVKITQGSIAYNVNKNSSLFNFPLMFMLIVVLATCFFGILYLNKKKLSSNASANGEATLSCELISARKVKQMVKKSNVFPDSKFDDELLSKFIKR